MSNATTNPGRSLQLRAEDFDIYIDDQRIGLFTLRNKTGCVAQITNYGARLVSLLVPDKNGEFRDVVLGFPSINKYINAGERYHGATIGRCANRIANGKFVLDGVKYSLTTNKGSNHLHGGNKGFESVVWEVNRIDSQSFKLCYLSKHMEEGYPGNLSVYLTYRLTDDNELQIEYEAITDKTTIVNLTHHSYFNLNGEGEEQINDHLLQINADEYTPLLEGSIPSGQIETLDNTPLDFREMQGIGERINENFEQLSIANGYDHNYVLRDDMNGIRCVAKAWAPESGILMKVYTDQPGIQFYTANFLNGSDFGKSGKPYLRRSAFCLETQHFPDSPNHAQFPSVILKPEENYQSVTTYKFQCE